MTWNVSINGTKAEVKAKVEEKVTGFHKHPAVTEAINKLVDEQTGPQVSVSGSGSDSSCSLSISSFK